MARKKSLQKIYYLIMGYNIYKPMDLILSQPEMLPKNLVSQHNQSIVNTVI